MEGFLGLLFGVFVLGIVPLFGFAFIFSTGWWEGYKKKMLPEKIYKVFEEMERTSIEREGLISPKFYKSFLQMNEAVELKNEIRYCPNCGKLQKPEWHVCPFCNNEKEL